MEEEEEEEEQQQQQQQEQEEQEEQEVQEVQEEQEEQEVQEQEQEEQEVQEQEKEEQEEQEVQEQEQEEQEEEEAVLNTVIVILDSIKWLIFVIILGGKEGEEGCPSGHLLMKDYARPIWRPAYRTTHFRMLQMFESWCVSAWVTGKFAGKRRF